MITARWECNNTIAFSPFFYDICLDHSWYSPEQKNLVEIFDQFAYEINRMK